MSRYAPPGTLQVKPQDLLVPTTYNPYRVPTFLEESCQFVDQCPVHPRTTARLGDGAALPVIKTREVSQRSASKRSPQAHRLNEKSADVRKIAYEARGVNDAAPVTSYNAPTFRTNARDSTGGGNSCTGNNAVQYYNSAGGHQQGGAFVPPPAPAQASWTGGEGLSIPYMPTYPAGDQRSYSHLLPRDAQQPSCQQPIRTRSRQSGMVDVLNASTSEGYTTVSAVRHMRPATKQCC